eukprot:jgi/Bigna1/135855/aug1.31_g10563
MVDRALSFRHRLGLLQSVATPNADCALLAVPGVDGLYNNGSRQLVNWLVLGESGVDLVNNAPETQLMDCMLVVSNDSFRVYCNPKTKPFFLRLTSGCCQSTVTIHCQNERKYGKDGDADEAFKIRAFVLMTEKFETILVPVPSPSNKEVYCPHPKTTKVELARQRSALFLVGLYSSLRNVIRAVGESFKRPGAKQILTADAAVKASLLGDKIKAVLDKGAELELSVFKIDGFGNRKSLFGARPKKGSSSSSSSSSMPSGVKSGIYYVEATLVNIPQQNQQHPANGIIT